MTKRITLSLQSQRSSSLKDKVTPYPAIRAVRRLFCVALMAAFLPSGMSLPAMAQDADEAGSQIVIIDRQSLFSATQYGRRVLETVEKERVRLASETRKAEELLLEEERQLTQQKTELAPEDFRKLAKAFDEKVQSLRNEGSRREQTFVKRLEREQAAFFERIGPILGELVRELGAVVIIDRRAVLLTARNIDITKPAVDRIDAVLGDGQDPDSGADARETPAAETQN